MPTIVRSGRNFRMTASIAPSPAPTSRTRAPCGSSIANRCDSTRIRRLKTKAPWDLLRTALATARDMSDLIAIGPFRAGYIVANQQCSTPDGANISRCCAIIVRQLSFDGHATDAAGSLARRNGSWSRGAGFVGSHLCERLLIDGARHLCRQFLDRRAPQYRAPTRPQALRDGQARRHLPTLRGREVRSGIMDALGLARSQCSRCCWSRDGGRR
jgi:hypothetical protein